MDFNSILDSIQSNLKSDSEIAEYEARQRREQIARFHENCGMDADYFSASIESNGFDSKTKATLAEYAQSVKDGKGMFLILLGNVGTGKTYSACAVMNELGFGTFLGMDELGLKLNTADRYGATENREMLLHRLSKTKLLVLDEVGRFKEKKDTEQEVLFYLLNKRYANNRPTVICSNLTVKEFSEYIGTALTDRLKGRNVKLFFSGESRRGK